MALRSELFQKIGCLRLFVILDSSRLPSDAPDTLNVAAYARPKGDHEYG